MSMKQAIYNQLVVQGKQKTAAQLAAQYKTTSSTITARINELRQEGFAIYANRKVDAQGREKTFYRHGAPSRAVVAAGYRALAAQKHTK